MEQPAVSRRRLLGLLGGLGGAVAAGAAALGLRRGFGPRPRMVQGTTRDVESYGPGLQRGEWWLPPGAATGRPLPTVVLVHGGYWRPGYDRSLEDAVAADLAGRGYLCWNIDYASSASPWPQTLLDAAAGWDALRHGRHAPLVDPQRVAVVGHSAGGHLALWLASRDRLPAGAPGAAPPGWLPPRLAVGQAPVAALALAARDGLGGGAAQALCGGTPAQVPERYRVADPVALVPTHRSTVLVHGSADDIVPVAQSQAYQQAARTAGDACRLQVVPGDHFVHLDPTSPACSALRDALQAGLGP